MSLNDLDQVIVNNLASMFLMCREAIPHLKRSNAPSIINLGSTYAFVGAEGSAAYPLTKAGAVSFTETLALELAGDVSRGNSLGPGARVTPLYRSGFRSGPVAPQARAGS